MEYPNRTPEELKKSLLASELSLRNYESREERRMLDHAQMQEVRTAHHKMKDNIIKAFVQKVLLNPSILWEVQGLGMLRAYIVPYRLSIWHHDLKTVTTTDIHNHPWWFTSYVVCGCITNEEYGTTETVKLCEGRPYNRRQIVTGEGTPVGEDEGVWMPYPIRKKIRPCSRYTMSPIWNHRTEFEDGTITIMQKLPDQTVLDPEADRQAYVHWPVGTEFESAKPRPATADEIRKYTNVALQQLNA